MDKNNTPNSNVKIGYYRHFKGGQYQVLGVARHSEHKDEEYVVYVSLANGTMWVRPLAMFLEEVDKPEYNYKGPRFQYIGDKLIAEF